MILVNNVGNIVNPAYAFCLRADVKTREKIEYNVHLDRIDQISSGKYYFATTSLDLTRLQYDLKKSLSRISQRYPRAIESGRYLLDIYIYDPKCLVDQKLRYDIRKDNMTLFHSFHLTANNLNETIKSL